MIEAKHYKAALLVTIFVLSGISVFNNRDLVNIPSLVISFIGFAAVVSFFLKPRLFLVLSQIWIIGQFPAISETISSSTTSGIPLCIHWDILNTGQTFSVPVGMTFGTSHGNIQIFVNILPSIFLILIRHIKLNEIVNFRISIIKFNYHKEMNNSIAPLNGSIEKLIKLDRKNWVLIKLDNDLIFSGNHHSHVLVKPKDSLNFKLRKNNLSEIRLVCDNNACAIEYPYFDTGIVNIRK